MTAEPHAVTVRFDADKLVLEPRYDDEGPHYVFPDGHGGDPGAPRAALTLAEAVHARIRPAGTAERILRAWAEGTPPRGPVGPEDPAAVPPVRVRAGAIVIRDGAMLLIRFEEDGAPYYEIPGGGVEAGETPEGAVVRELVEETGLAGTVGPEVARVWKGGRREHYFTVSATGGIGPPETLDNYGGTPVWIPVEHLPDTPLWPRRLSWRIEHWHRTGWPERPAELADSITELGRPCSW